MTEITRRSLLRTGATATAAVVIGVRPWDPAAAGAASAVATPLRRSDYTGLVGTDFAVADAPQAAVLRLASVADLARPALRGSEDAFSLTFSGDTPLDSGIHGLTHPQLGSFDLFVSPVETTERHRYQAVIDRSVSAPSNPPAGPAQPTGTVPATTPGAGEAPAGDGSGAAGPPGAGGTPAPDGSGAAQPSGGAAGPTGGALAGDGSGAARPSGTRSAPAPAGSGAAQASGAAAGKTGGPATGAAKGGARSAPPARRAAILQRATVRRLGRGARVEIALRASAHTVHVSLQRGGKSVVQGSHAVHDRRATVALRSAHHLPAGSYVLVVSAVDGTGSTLVQRRRIAVR